MNHKLKWTIYRLFFEQGIALSFIFILFEAWRQYHG